MAERGGRTLAIASGSEKLAVPEIKALLADGAILYTDEARAWSRLDYSGRHDRYVVPHKHMYSRKGVSTNVAETCRKDTAVAGGIRSCSQGSARDLVRT